MLKWRGLASQPWAFSQFGRSKAAINCDRLRVSNPALPVMCYCYSATRKIFTAITVATFNPQINQVSSNPSHQECSFAGGRASATSFPTHCSIFRWCDHVAKIMTRLSQPKISYAIFLALLGCVLSLGQILSLSTVVRSKSLERHRHCQN